MKSTSKFDYDSRYGSGGFGPREPLIRVELDISDDPRDKLAQEMFEGDEYPIMGCHRLVPIVGQISNSFLIYRKKRSERLAETASNTYTVLQKLDGRDFLHVCSNDKFFFEKGSGNFDGNLSASQKRVISKGISRESWEYGPYHEAEQEMIKAIIADYKEFAKLLK